MPYLHPSPFQYLLPYTAFYLALLVSDSEVTINIIFLNVFCYQFSLHISLSSTAAVGISFIQFTNINSMRNLYVLGVSLFLGISIPQYFVMKTDGAGNGPVSTGGGWVRNYIVMFLFEFFP